MRRRLRWTLRSSYPILPGQLLLRWPFLRLRGSLFTISTLSFSSFLGLTDVHVVPLFLAVAPVVGLPVTVCFIVPWYWATVALVVRDFDDDLLDPLVVLVLPAKPEEVQVLPEFLSFSLADSQASIFLTSPTVPSVNLPHLAD